MQRQVLVNAILIVVGTLRGAGAIVVLWLVAPTIETFLGWQIVSGVVGSGIFLVATWRSLPAQGQAARFDIAVFRGVWKYAAAVSANAIIGIILNQLDKVILSRMLSLEMFGYYTLAGTVGSTIWMIILPFNSAIFPRFVQLHELSQPEELRLFFHRTSQLLSLFLFPACALIIVFSKEILSLWLHDPAIVQHCHLIVSLLVCGTMINGMASVPGYSASAFGWPQLITYTNAVQAIIVVPLIIGLTYKYQGVGAAVAWIVLNSTYIVFMVPAYFRRYFVEDRDAWYWRDVAVPAVTAFTICICGFVVSPSASSSQLVVASWLVLVGAIALIATGGTLPHVRTLISSWS
ncbi:MAG: oligosaccharide flippase family protein [Nibricoccus sp.]